MAQPDAPKYVQTIPIAANIQPFRGLRADGELHFQPGSDVRTWLDSVDAYFLGSRHHPRCREDCKGQYPRGSFVRRRRSGCRSHSSRVPRANMGIPEGSVDFPLQRFQNLRSIDPNGTIYEYENPHQEHPAVTHVAPEDP